MTDTTVEDVINAAASIATDAAEGRLDPAQLEAQAVSELRELMGTVVGEDDPLWDLQRDVARQIVAHGGIPTAELSEWVAVARRRESPSAAEETAPSGLVPLGGADTPIMAVSDGSVAHGPESDTVPDDFTDVPREVIVQAEAAAMEIITRWRAQR